VIGTFGILFRGCRYGFFSRPGLGERKMIPVIDVSYWLRVLHFLFYKNGYILNYYYPGCSIPNHARNHSFDPGKIIATSHPE